MVPREVLGLKGKAARQVRSSEELLEEIRKRLCWIKETREEFINLARTLWVENSAGVKRESKQLVVAKKYEHGVIETLCLLLINQTSEYSLVTQPYF